LVLAVAALVLAADIVSKVMVVARIPEQTYVHVIGSVFMLTQVRNGGAAFNLGGTSNTIVFTAIAVGVVIYILRAASSLHSTGWAIALGLLLGGATGNLIDRVFRAPGPLRGDVVDWIYVTRYWPVFNVADSCIVCGGVLIVLLALRGIRLDGTRPIPAASSPQPDPPVPDPPVPDPPVPDSPAPDTSASDSPESEYPEQQAVVPGQADAPGRVTDEGR
jgi:signal peptidase II